MKILWAVLFGVLLSSNPIYTAKILGIFPAVAKSHWAVGVGVLKALGEKGHDITVISPFTMPKSNNVTYRDVQLTGLEEEFLKMIPRDIINSISMWPFLGVVMVLNMGLMLVENVMEHPNVKTLIAEKPEFDLVIVESFGTETLYAFGEHFNAPVITVSTTTTLKWLNDLVGTPDPWSYVPNAFLKYTPKMSFCERLTNAAMNIFEFAFMEFYYYGKQDNLKQKYFPNSKKSMRQMMREDVSLVFLNTHFSLSFPRPYVPNMIEIGGINIDRKLNTLPKDVQQFLDSAKDGAILFSMGSFLKAGDLKPEQRSAFIKAFGQLKQKVVWRYELPDAPQLPKNILPMDWLPQKEIMSHPNVKLFITHGGMLGTTEGIYHGLPMIGLPVYGDQHLNIARAQMRGYALQLDLKNVTEESVTWAINEIFANAKYIQNAQRLSKIYRDQPMTPQQTAVYWTEYIINHKGAPHMKVEGQNLGFLHYHNLDVWLVIFLAFVAFVLVPEILIIRWLFRRFVFKAKPKQKSN